jgi:hypothetical protein
MSIELDRQGGGAAAFMLSFGTLLALEKNRTLVHDELADMRDATRVALRDYSSLPVFLATVSSIARGITDQG